MGPPQEARILIAKFGEFEGSYTSSTYKETEVRREFIDPFFAILGWDVRNKGGKSPATKDVVHEYTIETPIAKRMPDYSFRIGGETKFFVEAKKPSENVKDGIAAAFQVRTYGWSAKIPLSILTDFQELTVYDCLNEPVVGDSAATGRRKYFHWTEYEDRWDELVELLSRDSVASGSLEAFAAVDDHDFTSVDEAFLKEMEGWRRDLAQDIAAKNGNLSQRDLNFAVQQTLDRIVFLRICEDRGIETFGQLQEVAGPEGWGDDGQDVYGRLRKLFVRADDRYNSGLFHFKKEADRDEPPDTLTPNLNLSNAPLKGIIRRLYFPESSYRFAVFPADILGQVYEQFLGKVIRLDIHEGAVVEDKPEVRKAGGVYYTPTYIVSYIVENAVGRSVAGKNPAEVEGHAKGFAPLRIVDPACGSGSFLIEAYQYLLDWYRDAYEKNTAKWVKGKQPRIFRGPNDEWFLTGTERKRILIDHVFGVDLDPQAVEVTKLSLLLKVLEGESTETIMQTMQLFHERALPDLSKNIKRGNSLIGTDFYQTSTPSLLEEGHQLSVSAFDWTSEFPDVFEDGGFNVVVGNPPYLSIDDVWGEGDERQRYLKRTYPEVYRDKTDVLFYFLARALEISSGEVSFIVSRAFLEAYKADKLRQFIVDNSDVREIIDFRNFLVFPRVGITTSIISATRSGSEGACEVYKLLSDRVTPPLKDAKGHPSQFQRIEVPQAAFSSKSWVFTEKSTDDLLKRIDEVGDAVGSILHIGQGMQTGRNGVFGKIQEETADQWKLPPDLYFVRARNSDIQRWHIKHSKEIILFPENVKRFDQLPPVVQEHLHTHEQALKSRAAYKRGDCDWWKFTWPLHKAFYDRNKLFCPYLASANRFAVDRDGRYLGLTDTTVLFDNSQPEDLRYIMALLNSAVLSFRFRFIGKLKAGGVFEYFWNGVSQLPIRRIDFQSPAEMKVHDDLVALAESAILISDQMDNAKTEQDLEVFRRRIRGIENNIDEIVFDIYGLSAGDRDSLRQELAHSSSS